MLIGFFVGSSMHTDRSPDVRHWFLHRNPCSPPSLERETRTCIFIVIYSFMRFINIHWLPPTLCAFYQRPENGRAATTRFLAEVKSCKGFRDSQHLQEGSGCSSGPPQHPGVQKNTQDVTNRFGKDFWILSMDSWTREKTVKWEEEKSNFAEKSELKGILQSDVT